MPLGEFTLDTVIPLLLFRAMCFSFFSNLVESCIGIFIDVFFLFRSSFHDCVCNPDKVLKRNKEKNLTLNWEKCRSMVKRGIILGHVISKDGTEADEAKTDLIVNLHLPLM